MPRGAPRGPAGGRDPSAVRRAEVRSGWPYLNVGCDDLPGGDFRLPLMGEYRQVVSRALRIELPVGHAEPAQGQRAVLEDRIVSEADALSLRVNLFEGHEEIQIVRVPKQLTAAPKKKRIIQVEVDEDADEEEVARLIAAKKAAQSGDEKAT